jgi:hypothetical protein
LALGQEAGFGLKAGGLLAHPPDTQIEPFRVSGCPKLTEETSTDLSSPFRQCTT